MRQANILDEIHETLAPNVWEDPGSPRPTLKPQHAHWITQHIFGVLDKHGYTNAEKWLQLVLTGSLTTYQYGPESDCDVSLFVNASVLPEWSRAEMIGIMIANTDGVTLPGTPYPMQCYVVSKKLTPADLYKEGLRSGYDIRKHKWIQPPDRSRDHDVEQQENGFYVYALEQADKMERMLRYEPDKAVQFWHQIHQRRQKDQTAGKGDFALSNIVYKFLANRGLFPKISEVSGDHIAKTADAWGGQWAKDIAQQQPYLYHAAPKAHRQAIQEQGLVPNASLLGSDTNAHGVYMEPNAENAMAYWGSPEHDLWRIPQDQYRDTLQYDPAGEALYVPHGVRAEHIAAETIPMAPPIRPHELSSPTAIERGHSRPVSEEEWHQIAEEGRQRYEDMARNADGSEGLNAQWPWLQEHAWQSVQQPWGGATINAATGAPIQGNEDLYALTAKPPGEQTLSIPINASRDHFMSAMDEARKRYAHLLERANHHLGIFRDEDVNRIDFDPVVTTNNQRDAEAIGAHTRNVGGAYHFASGDGFWPPHVPESHNLSAAPGGPWPTYAEFRSANRTELPPEWVPEAE